MPIDLNYLNGPQRRIVREALLAAFDQDSLDMLLEEELKKQPLLNLVPVGTFETMVFKLIRRSTKEYWTENLIEAAERNSENPKIKKLRQTLENSDALDLAAIDKGIGGADGLERLVRDGGFADWGLWVDRMAGIGRQICRIEYPVGIKMGGGTGFLVGPDLVLTNFHVIEPFISGPGALNPSCIRCRFDYAVGSSDSGAGKAIPLVDASDWMVDHSPYSSYDPGDHGGLPQPDQLDYALLRLASAVGDNIIGGEKRGWIILNPDTALPKAGEILFIGQHPKLNPLKLAVGSVLQTNSNGTRLRYNTNTENGSSGSPCLNTSLELVALHHGGDPDYGKLWGDYNQGIPIGLVAKQIANRNAMPL
jgi:hypothetical protein